MNETSEIRALSNGFNQKGVRDHNERLILSTLLRHGDLPGSDIARHTRLSAQTVSVILRKLDQDGLLTKGAPKKGKVGKPSVPIALNSNGAYAIGYKIGRRSSEMCLTNLSGDILFEKQVNYEVALPKDIFRFLETSFETVMATFDETVTRRLCGIGIALPFEIWKWDISGKPAPDEFLSWKDVDFKAEVAKFTRLPVYMVNDATGACWAEHVYGRGKEFSDYAYFFVSTFIGGGIVINQSVYEGTQGNAGSLGSLRVGDAEGRTRQLIDCASIHLLEAKMKLAGLDPQALWHQPQDWSPFDDLVSDWIAATAPEIARACLSACAVIDFEAILIDGAFPADIRQRLVTAIQKALPLEDSRGLILPKIAQGTIGGQARVIGAGCAPVFAQYFLSANPRSAA